MIDYFALALSHGLILIALIRLVSQKALDEDPKLGDGRKKRRSAQPASGQSMTNQGQPPRA